LLSIFGSKTTSNFLPGFGKVLSNSRPDPKIGVAYKKNVYCMVGSYSKLMFILEKFSTFRLIAKNSSFYQEST